MGAGLALPPVRRLANEASGVRPRRFLSAPAPRAGPPHKGEGKP